MNRAEVDAHRQKQAERLTRVEEKMDSVVESQRETKLLLQMQNGRVRKVEQKQAWLFGGIGAVTFIYYITQIII